MANSESPNVIIRFSDDERRARELMKLVRKLHWIGEHDQAERLQHRLRVGNCSPCVLASPWDTD